MAEILRGGPRVWVFAASPGQVDVEHNVTTIESLAAAKPTRIITNGTFFNPKTTGHTLGIVHSRNGSNNGNRMSDRYWFGITNAGVATIGGPGEPANYAANYSVLLSGLGLLLKDGEYAPLTSSFAVNYRNSRIRPAIGIRRVDGRQQVLLYVTCGGLGKRLSTVARELRNTYGCTGAVWLDGSSALALAVNGRVIESHEYSKQTNWVKLS